MDLSNQTELEIYFADHFDTVLFPVLAEIYLSSNDFLRAKKVCEIGLGYHPHNPDGQFILAKAELGLGNLDEAERQMKKVLKIVPDHSRAAVTLPILQEQLNRAESTLKASWKRALKADPDNKLAREYSSESTSQKKKVKKKTSSKAGDSPRKITPDIVVDTMDISPRLATFTFVAVLRNQGLFHHALDILNILEKKGADQKRLDRERKAIMAEIQI